MIESKPFFYDCDLVPLQEVLSKWGEADYRGKQLWQGMYRELKVNAAEISNLPETLRQKITDNFEFSHLTPTSNQMSKDGNTRKVLFSLPDGHAVETVLMRYEKRETLCISTQSGCALGCVFCATGQMGFRRNLSSGEIIEQVVFFARELKDSDREITNVVFMGMGEPFHNYEGTLAAIDRLNHKVGMNLGARRFTISTVGLVPEILRFADERRQTNLAVSLHAADDELRSYLLPINKKYPLNELINACRAYISKTNRRITFEWALIQDVNDSIEQAHKLSNLIRGLLSHVNVIPLNPTRGYSGLATTMERAREFQVILERNGIPCTIRARRGIDIHAGCGQLAAGQMN
jgi:23S rRNA (adenine2503-C2)-methyltransferase